MISIKLNLKPCFDFKVPMNSWNFNNIRIKSSYIFSFYISMKPNLNEVNTWHVLGSLRWKRTVEVPMKFQLHSIGHKYAGSLSPFIINEGDSVSAGHWRVFPASSPLQPKYITTSKWMGVQALWMYFSYFSSYTMLNNLRNIDDTRRLTSMLWNRLMANN